MLRKLVWFYVRPLTCQGLGWDPRQLVFQRGRAWALLLPPELDPLVVLCRPLPSSHLDGDRPWVCASLGLPDVIQGPEPRPSGHGGFPLEYPHGRGPKILLSHSHSQLSSVAVEASSHAWLVLGLKTGPGVAGRWGRGKRDRTLTCPCSPPPEEKKGAGGGGGPVRLRSTSRKDSISEDEMVLRERSYDYQFRYCGHCNTTTDIKEANFFGRSEAPKRRARSLVGSRRLGGAGA